MDPWSAKDQVVGERAIEHCKGHVQVHSADVDKDCDVSNGELLLSTESNEDDRATTNVGFIDLHLFKCIYEQKIGRRAIFDEDPLDHAIGYQEADDQSIVVKVDKPCGIVVDKADDLVRVDTSQWLRGACLGVN